MKACTRVNTSCYSNQDEFVKTMGTNYGNGASSSTSKPRISYEKDNVDDNIPRPLSDSTTSSLDMNSIDIGEITENPDTTLMSTSAVLFYCKSKILYPYLRFLAVMGFRPASLDQLQNSKFYLLLSHYHTLQITILVCLGYILQYMSCFRRDRGLIYNNLTIYQPYEHKQLCYGSPTFSYILPSTLHFAGYIYAIYLFRISDNEHLQNLMERVFLLSSFPSQGTPYTSPKKLLRILWLYIIFSLIWILLSLVNTCLMLAKVTVEFQWIGENYYKWKLSAKIVLIISTLCHDMVEATIVTNYCLQAQLLTAHLQYLRNRLLTRTISPLDWMREIAEFKKLLRHLNEVLAPGVCLFLIVNICWTFSSLICLLKLDKVNSYVSPISITSILNQILWTLAAIIPFISAARLTRTCSMIQCVGHEIIVRPFLHQETPQEDLNAVLLYASSLQLSARLFRLPVTGRYLCFTFMIISAIILILGMCHYIEI